MTPRAFHPTLDHRTKGIPGGTREIPLAEIGSLGWNVLRQNQPLPLAILHESAIANNARWMREFCERANVSFAPHGKTTMCPQLFQRQLDNGAWAITLSTAHQVQVARDFGVSRILLANQIVDPTLLTFVLSELAGDPAFDFLCLVDSVEGVRLAGELIRAGKYRNRLSVLIEVGADGGRTGVRTVDEALAVADAIAAYSHEIELRGVESFEGIFSGPAAANVDRVSALMDQVTATVRALDYRGHFRSSELVLSAGGSAYYDIVVDRLLTLESSKPSRIVTRSGCYIAHDAILYRDYFESLVSRSDLVRAVQGELLPALQVATYVQSMPEPGMVLLNGGKRDLSYDIHLPAPSLYFRRGEHTAPIKIGGGHEIYALADQHAFMRVPAESPLRIGDIVFLDISHPCTTFDKWDVLYGIDADYNVTTAYKTYF